MPFGGFGRLLLAVAQAQAVSAAELSPRASGAAIGWIEEFAIAVDQFNSSGGPRAVGMRVVLEPELGKPGVVALLLGAEWEVELGDAAQRE